MSSGQHEICRVSQLYWLKYQILRGYVTLTHKLWMSVYFIIRRILSRQRSFRNTVIPSGDEAGIFRNNQIRWTFRFAVTPFLPAISLDTFARAMDRQLLSHGPLTRYVELWVAHAPGIPGTFSRHRLQRKTLASDPGMRRGTCITHVPWCMSGSLTRSGG